MSGDMEAFWDERARENAPYFVDNRLDYGRPDLEQLWAGGEQVVDTFLEALGLELRPEFDAVELGCGIGRVTRALAGRVRSVRALDISGEMLARARTLNSQLANVEWTRCDGRSLTGVPDASCDVFISHVVFQHLPDPEITYGYIADVGRVLRPRGWAAVHVSDDPSVHRPRRRGIRHPAWLGSAIDLARLRAVAEASTLRVTRIVGERTQFCLVALQRTGERARSEP
jgi:ubiquinone/menaquinone biosynthesis C-methylase UbiE